MQLQKQLSRAVEGKEYPKFVIVIPPTAIEELEWREGQELEHEVKDQALIIRKAKGVDEEVMRIASRHTKIRRK